MPGAPENDGGRSPIPPPASEEAPPLDAFTMLRDVLEEARSAGFLGPGPLEQQMRHAQGFARVARRLATRAGLALPRVVDLGSGGGLPGLVVTCGWPEARLVLLEANGRRAAFLQAALRRLELEGRASVLHERAELAGRRETERGAFDGVLARSFGPPAVVAECAAPLLRTGGWLVVSEPPPDSRPEKDLTDACGRWPTGELAQLGLEPVEALHEDFAFQVLRQAMPCPERFPRRDGVPAKRPLF